LCDRDDGDERVALRRGPLWVRAIPRVTAPGRPDDRRWACASCSGVFNNYALVQGVDKIVPVDVYVPGCPPTPDALLDSIIKLKERVAANSRSARHGATTAPGVSIPRDSVAGRATT
jgi:hypothetical protein